MDEAYSSQTCSFCNRRTGPKGLEGRGIREWACFEGGACHHRDINAAENFLAFARRRLTEAIPVVPAPGATAEGWEREAVKILLTLFSGNDYRECASVTARDCRNRFGRSSECRQQAYRRVQHSTAETAICTKGTRSNSSRQRASINLILKRIH
ncbi:zinc ribbon domain-containing protein [Paraburkholderia sp.]|uniref:zinc ribbon domain-containing protein n=1 Tax=Paraburkholderia sp. TaxID=1926495 RepID=UPI0039C96FA8